MLAIEKPFPLVTASLGGIASLAVGFVGAVALLSAFTPSETAQTPETTNSPTTVASTSASDSEGADSSPQLFTSSYKSPASQWTMTATNKPAASPASSGNSATSPSAPAPAPTQHTPTTPEVPAVPVPNPTPDPTPPVDLLPEIPIVPGILDPIVDPLLP